MGNISNWQLISTFTVLEQLCSTSDLGCITPEIDLLLVVQPVQLLVLHYGLNNGLKCPLLFICPYELCILLQQLVDGLSLISEIHPTVLSEVVD